MAHTSRCGLGATSPNPILTTLTKFPEIYPVRPRATVADLLPSFDPEAELTDHAAAVDGGHSRPVYKQVDGDHWP